MATDDNGDSVRGKINFGLLVGINKYKLNLLDMSETLCTVKESVSCIYPLMNIKFKMALNKFTSNANALALPPRVIRKIVIIAVISHSHVHQRC